MLVCLSAQLHLTDPRQKLTGFLEDQITAPSGREVVITSRRVSAVLVYHIILSC